MNDSRVSESGSLDVTVIPEAQWDQKLSRLRESGVRMARDLRDKGHSVGVEVLGATEVRGGDSVPLSGVVLKLDWKMAAKMEMVEFAREMITMAYKIDSLDPALPYVLGSIIEGKGLYEHSVGELFELYGRFEEKHQLKRGSDTREEMSLLVNGDKRYLRMYTEHGKNKLVPLPYAVRNILAHAGTNPNKLDQESDEIRTSINLLRSWVN